MKPFVTKWIGGILLMFLSLLNLQAQTDTLCNPNENRKIFGELYFNYGSATNVYSQFNRSTFVVGQPLVSTQNMLSEKYQSGLGVYSPWYLPPQPPILTATQGDFKDRIKLVWNVNPLSPTATGFVIYRDGSFLTELGENQRDFLDFNVQAGEYYEYSIEAKNLYGTGSRSKYVGFVNPNGVVSGKITTNSGNPVPGVEVRLTPLTGSSIEFDGIDDELCVSYNNKLPTDKFTISAYVKLGDTNNETGIIDWGSTLNKNWWITTTKGNEARGYVFHVGNGTGSDSLRYFLANPASNPKNIDNWHQITMVYNGAALSVMVDGEFVGTKPASISHTKNYLNIGSKIGNGGFFKGHIDDVRIYNRPLTQTEVQSTKNRSVSKNENGLVAYWKMDEGIGEKVFDNSAIPTNANIYGGAKFSPEKPEVYNAGISDGTGYYAIDGINYSTTESFRATPIKNFEFNSAIEFNATDKSYGNLTDFDIPDTSTVEVLFHPFDLKSRQTILSKGTLYEAYIDNGKLFLSLNGTITDLGDISSKYYHLAVTIDNRAGSAKVYLEGDEKRTVSFSGILNWKNGTDWLLATNSTDATTGKFYTGLIDEFAIYKTALPLNQIQGHFVTGIPQDSTTKNLYSYFDLNEGSDTLVYDYATINFGAKDPREGILKRANWSNNARRKQSKAHMFEPNVRVVNLNTSNTAVGNIDFKDVSTVNVSGTVRFANTFCFADSIDILVNGQPYFPSIRTNKKGIWSADFEPGKTVKLSPFYKDHLFTPSFFELRKLQAPKAGVVFLDNTKRTISGQIAGNEKCRKSITPTGSIVVVKVATLDGCFERTDTIRNTKGEYTFKDLPARAFNVSVIKHSNSEIYNYLQLKGGQIVDLRDTKSAVVDFIYVAPPKIEITGIEAKGECRVRTIGMNAGKSILKFRGYEVYYGDACYVDNVKFTINDPSTGRVTDTTLAKNKTEYIYEFVPTKVNVISPYTQTVTATAEINNAKATDTTSFVVLGQKANSKTFTTSTPEVPLWILRDPPGDGSYATLESGSTTCINTTRTVTNFAGEQAKISASIGGEQSIGGFGVAMKTTNRYTYSVSGGSEQTWVSNTTEETCATTTRTISTSPNDVVVGSSAGGDVYVGAAMNVTYGSVRELNFDYKLCKFTLIDKISIAATSLKSDFVYSERQIINDVIPSLKLLAADPSNSNRIQDSTAAVKWQEYINQNRADKGKEIKSISFDANAIYDESFSIDNTQTENTSFESNGHVNLNGNLELDYGWGGLGLELDLTYSHSKMNDDGNSTNNNKTYSFHLEDDDVGDNFFVKVYDAMKWNDTKIFEIVAGESSCPWEYGTKPRSEPFLKSIDGVSRVNVPANTSAVYRFELGNNSPTDEPMSYDISVDPASNPDGAIVKLNGQPLTQPVSFRIDPGTTQSVTMTIDRGPTAFEYDSLIVQLESACETELADARGGDGKVDSLFVRTLALSASFIEPCSSVDIGFPLQDWVLTPADKSVLDITLNEYDKNDTKLKLIRLQYRRIGDDGSWLNISETLKADLGPDYTNKQWNIDREVKDGRYEIRAVAECLGSTLPPGISTVVKGEIARTPPEIVGVLEPGDGTWDPGDEISITFNEQIDCEKVIQADIKGNNTIGLYDATTNTLVNATISCVGNKIVIVPKTDLIAYENRTFRVKISGKDYDDEKIADNSNHQRAALRDKAGNMIPKTITWEFAINQNNLEWVGTDVIETNEVLKPFTVKRQIRNRGGSIASFKMESIPSWLTVTPSTGTLNPGQVADVTLTFQQDLLIGDYLDTLQMVGSRGSEPLLIDYRVRCPQPKYEVVDPEQYEGSMNMVVDLSIFGVHSTDPSDVVVAKIGGQIRGVGRVAYYRNIPADKQRWLTFLTIYGNADDVDKPIEFTIWDGNKCNEYVEILEQYTFQDGGLVGSPLVPTPVSVLNLVKKCIPLNKGFNWVSFNLDLGTGRNTVKNVLSSLKNKTGAYIKTDNNFAEYLGNGIWDALDSTIYPTKRYMVYVLNRDTVCLKGAPYTPSQYPIKIKTNWNWIGYVPSTGMTVTQAFKGLVPLNGDIIKSQTLFAQYVANVGWIGNLSFVEPLKGYLLKISNPGVLTYPTINNSLQEAQALPSTKDLAQQALQETPMTFDFTQYNATMNLIGKVSGINIDADDELRAYIDGKLVGVNKSITNSKDRLFFQTIYHDDQRNISFKLYKADRAKEYDLNKTVQYIPETVAGLVENPIVFELVNANATTVSLAVDNVVISQPAKVFQNVSIPNSVITPSAACTTFAFNTVLPSDNTSKPSCSQDSISTEGNMSAVIKVNFNELSSFVSANDIITFVNSTTNAKVGCATLKEANNLFYGTIGGSTTSTEVPIDIKYYSSLMKKSFTLKSGLTYKYNSRLGNALTPYSIDVSPLQLSKDANGIITAVLKDTSWVGKYCVNVFAMNCNGYNDGQTTFCFQRLKQGDCVDVEMRKVTETQDKVIQALSISSIALINSGVNMYYKAGDVIELKPGFDTSSSAIFTGKIEGCNNKTSTVNIVPTTNK